MTGSFPLVIALVIGFVFLLRSVRYHHNHTIEHVTRLSNHLEKVTIMSVQDSVDAIVAQLGKAKGEVVAKIAEVQAALDAAGVPAEQVDLSALVAAAQSLDDVVPDAVVGVPVEVPADEPVAVEVPAEAVADVPSEEV